MHMEDEDESGLFFLTRKQTKLLLKVLRSLMAYFGLYFLSQQLDKHLKTSDDFDKIQILPAVIGIEAALVI
jgi:hypothetical protein